MVLVAVAACAATAPSPRPSPNASSTVAPATQAPTASGSSGAPSTALGSGTPGTAVALKVVADHLDAPVDVTTADDGSGRIFVVEQGGVIEIVKGGKALATPFLDLSSRISSGGERGLLGLAFHPGYPSDPQFFVDYTDPNGDTVIASFRVDPADPDRADPTSELVLLTIKQPFPNHNGGSVAFGNDGLLYVGMGDGGSGGDPQGNGQRLDTLLGKILRLDVLGPDATAAEPYAIPSDNPYASGAAGLPEIWLRGLRNPWRIRFDRPTGILWIADVGQSAWEEVDAIAPGMGGSNLGWNTMEGAHCYAATTCDPTGLTLPVTEYDHGQGCSITGGLVAHDPVIPGLADQYLFADYCSGTMWSIDATTTSLTRPTVLLESGRAISAFGVDEDGSVLVTDVNGGALLRLVTAP